jgi:homoserine dehydrogenase
MLKPLRIGLLGCGTVGGGFVQLVERERERIRARYGVDLSIERILVRTSRPHAIFTTSAVEVLDADCDVIVELIGGVHSAGAFVRRAIAQGRHVVTANKALLAACGGALFDAAAARGVTIGFEASVCGAIPVVRALRQGLAGDAVESIRGVVNGTCNFVLSRMEEGLALDDALRLAQERGFAEADASLDVDGIDAAQKIRILAGIGFDAPVVHEQVDGIRGVTAEAIARSRAGGGAIRLIAEAERVAGGVAIRVGPRELDANDVFANVRDENNAVVIRGRASGELLLTGPGAGALPTAAAVLADVIEIARESARGWAG